MIESQPSTPTVALRPTGILEAAVTTSLNVVTREVITTPSTVPLRVGYGEQGY